MFIHLLTNLIGSFGGSTVTQTVGQVRPTGSIGAWTGEGRIRRAIEAALAKGRGVEDARRCQTSLITATDTGNILFETGSADLDRRSHQTLDGLAEIIKGCPGFVIEVEGHTDSAGDLVANLRLSERRAVAVRDYLLRAGVLGTALDRGGLRRDASARPQRHADQHGAQSPHRVQHHRALSRSAGDERRLSATSRPARPAPSAVPAAARAR